MWLAMETTELEFEFFLAAKLRMTVDRMRREMPMREYVGWSVYYGREAQKIELARKG